MNVIFAQTSEPAGGAPLGDLVWASAAATLATVALLVLASGHRSGRIKWLGQVADFAAGVSGLPRWCALPSALAGGALILAMFGFFWDVSVHIDHGRDSGPFGTPAHYAILAGIGGIAARRRARDRAGRSGGLAVVDPARRRAGRCPPAAC